MATYMDVAKRRCRELAVLTDAQMYDAFCGALNDRRNINFAPFLVTALQEEGLWSRLQAEEARRSRHDA